jgi:SAM-dependent methyltransferase
MVDQVHAGDSFGVQWNLHQRTQLDSYSGLSITRDRLARASRWPADLRGQRVLEAGSGAGRFTEVLLQTGAEVFTFDTSGAVSANRANHGGHPRVRLFQADLTKMPIAPGRFDKVLCLGVLQHTPDPERSFAALAAQVRAGGDLVIDVYARRLSSLLHWKYLLRPITRRIRPRTLYAVVSAVVPALVGPTRALRAVGGAALARMSPIVEYSRLGVRPALNREWAILDTFDMYAPRYDRPQSLETVRGWFASAGFDQVTVEYGPNGIVGRGRKR